MMRRVRQALVDGRVVDDVVIALDEDARIVELRPGRTGDGPAQDGLLLPGLVNAHTHLELGGVSGLPQGAGFPPWARALAASARAPDAAAAGAAALRQAGVTAVLDVSNGGDTAGAIAAAGLTGLVAHEVLGFAASGVASKIAALRWWTEEGIAVRPAPHALFSTHVDLVRAAAAAGRFPTTLHLAEDPDERRFLADGSGPFADLLDHFGVDRTGWTPPGMSAVTLLARLGVLRPDVLLVHAVDVDATDISAIAAAQVPVCLCPRSNLAIGGRLPPVARLVAAGIRLAIGTDSLASCPDLDPLGDVVELCRRVQDVDPVRWLVAATAGGADALARPDLGRLVLGARPDLLFLHGQRGASLRAGLPTRSAGGAP